MNEIMRSPVKNNQFFYCFLFEQEIQKFNSRNSKIQFKKFKNSIQEIKKANKNFQMKWNKKSETFKWWLRNDD